MDFYATYLLGCFYDDIHGYWSPEYYKNLSLVEYGYSVLGLKYDNSFSLDLNIKENIEESPYVCISTHASSLYKEWLYEDGWIKIIKYLNDLGYKVYVIDAEEKNNTDNKLIKETVIPENAINKTGYLSLVERAKLLSGADFFIGVSSGLSWLAWACKIPVVLISGFTNPRTEFYTPYRVINYASCNSCWNDYNIKWDINTTICPRKQNLFANDFLECSTKINLYTVIDKINKIPCVIQKLESLNC